MKATGHRSTVLNTRGFTLLEVMIALAIISITVTVILHTVNYQSGIMYENTLRTTILQAAKEKIVELEIDNIPSKGVIGSTGLTFAKTVSKTEYPGIIELRVTVEGDGRKFTLNELVRKKEIR